MNTPVHFVGLLQSPVSWAKVSRELLAALVEIGCPVTITPARGFLYSPQITLDPRLVSCITDAPVNPDVQMVFDYPPLYKRLTGKKNIALLVYEASRLPPGWVDACNQYVDRITVPSQHCVRILQQSGVRNDTIVMIPYGFNPTHYYPGPVSQLREQFTFLSVATPHKRKCLKQLIHAFFTVFHDQPAVRLIIKVPYIPRGKKAFWEDDIQDAGAPRVMWIRDLYTELQMAELYRSCDCYVQPSVSEGFGLSILEALACGKPVIVTGWGGHMDFCAPDNAFVLDYTMQQADDMQYGDKAADACVAIPSQKHLEDTLYTVWHDQSRIHEKVQRARQSVQHLTWRHMAEDICTLIQSI